MGRLSGCLGSVEIAQEEFDSSGDGIQVSRLGEKRQKVI